MTPLERIQTAIDKLERWKREITRGTWVQVEHFRPSNTGTTVSIPMSSHSNANAYAGTAANAALIVALHRTIDPQLNILRGALTDPELLLYGEAHGTASHALALADAILGAAS